MNGGTKIGRIAGIDIRLHLSWWFILVLLSWSLATSYFPLQFKGYSVGWYWVMGVIAAVLLFVSVLLHELSHSFVARWKNIEVTSITLFFFGGVAGITKEDMKPQDEFMMAIAGPLFSLFLGGLCYVMFKFVVVGIWLPIFSYLYQLNITLAVFNLLPAFPLDGGRAFRAVLYGYMKDLSKATKWAAIVSRGFAMLMMVLGVVSLFIDSGSGVWFILLGGFLYFLAGVSYEQVLMRQTMMKYRVREVMSELRVVDPTMTFFDFLSQYGYMGEEIFYVCDEKFRGVLDMRFVQPMSISMQQVVLLSQVAMSLDELRSIGLNDTAYEALQMLLSQRGDVLVVKERGEVLGFVIRRRLMESVALELKFGVSGINGTEDGLNEREIGKMNGLKQKKKNAKKKKVVGR